MAVNIRGPVPDGQARRAAHDRAEIRQDRQYRLRHGRRAASREFSHYVTSKGAVTAFTRALSRELGEHGICVNTLAPGFTLSRHRGRANPGMSRVAGAAAMPRRALKRDECPGGPARRADLPCLGRQRLHHRPDAGGRRRRQQHLSRCPGQVAAGSPIRTCATLDCDFERIRPAHGGPAGALIAMFPAGTEVSRLGQPEGGPHVGRDGNQARPGSEAQSTGRPAGLLRQDLQVRHGAPVGGAARTSSPRSRRPVRRRRSGSSRTSRSWCWRPAR